MARQRFEVVQDNLGKVFLIDNVSRTRYPVTGSGQLKGATTLFGPVRVRDPNGGPVKLTGWTQGRSVVDLYGGPGGIERVIRGERRDPLAGGYWSGKGFTHNRPGTPTRTIKVPGRTIPDPPKSVTDPKRQAPEPQPVNLRAQVKALYPWMPKALLDTFMEEWDKTGDHQQALAAVRSSRAYEAHFPGNKTEEGQVRMTEADYVAYRTEVKQVLRQHGYPQGFFDSAQDIGRLVSGEVSIREVRERALQGIVKATQAHPSVRDELQRMFGVSPGQMAAFWWDPNRALELIERDYAMAQIGGAAQMQGFGDLSRDEAARLQSVGIDFDTARAGFGELGRMRELLGALPGQTTERNVSRDDQLGLMFEDDTQAMEQVRKQAERRAAVFSGGGGAFAGGAGFTGLGSATR